MVLVVVFQSDAGALEKQDPDELGDIGIIRPLAQSFHSHFPKTFFMDNPNKKKADGKRISKQPHEVAYQAKKAAAGNGKTAIKKATKKKA